jgi:uncharacterized protein (PEP-CTERM system associated)
MGTATEAMSGSWKRAGSFPTRKKARRPHLRTIASAGVALSCLFGQAAFGGDWLRSNGITAMATAVDRTGNNAQSGLVLQLSPQFGLVGQSGRSKADVNYRLTLSLGLGSTDPRPLAHNLVAVGEVEAVEDFFFLGANAGARLGGSSSFAESIDAINFNADQGRQSFSVGLMPRFVAHLNRYVDLVSNNAVNYVTYSDDSAGGDDSSFGTRLHIGARSGRYFGPWSWRADASERKTEYPSDSARDSTRSRAEFGVGYPINAHFLLRGSAGYEDNDIQTSRSVTSGSIWDVGLLWKPNPRTSLNAKYGSRYFGDAWSAFATHRTRRSQLTLGTSRDADNRRTEELVDSNLFLLDDDGFIVTDPNTGDPISAEIPDFEDTNEDFINTRIRGILRLTGRRTTVTLTGEVSNRDYEVSSIDEDALRVSLAASRQIGSEFIGTAVGDFDRRKRQDGVDSDIYTIGFTLSRQIARKTSVSLNLMHRDRSSSVPSAEYTENRIGVALTTSLF